MIDFFSKRVIAFLSVIFILFSINVIGQQESNISKKEYKNIIVKGFYTFQNEENAQFLDSILTIIRLNKFTIKEDSINSKILYLKGVNNLELKRLKKAEDLFIKSFELAEKTNDIFLKGSIYNSRGVIFSLRNEDYNKVAKYYKKAIESYKKVSNLSQLIDTYYNLTINARKRYKWEESIAYGKNFFKLIAKDGKRVDGVGKMYYYIADSNFKLKNNEEALKNLKKAEKYTSVNNSELLSLINSLYAKYYESKEEYLLAVKKYKEVNENLEKTIVFNEKEIKESFVHELELESELKEKQNLIITNQKLKLIVSTITLVLFIILTIFLISLIRKNRNKNRQIKTLNIELKELIANLKTKNDDLVDKKTEIESLLNLNEQALFSRVLKISTYNDAIRKITEDIESNKDASSYLISVNKKLLSLISEEELWEDFKIQFEKIRPDFFSKLKQISPNLSVNDLKHCTYIVSNLKSKEVAQLINVSPRSVETTRYRVKKKMGLEKEDSLYDLLSSL
ncbi:tetratricopeptide repeat protein [Tenacibaculum soleae]|uniref:tetratricopeptide repeat protein n=1 Tax=Tenacibaculum soleae TaxID=447689 RepID=UPI002301F840|nr:hypothetical protein [Tenacibaculum soleae]